MNRVENTELILSALISLPRVPNKRKFPFKISLIAPVLKYHSVIKHIYSMKLRINGNGEQMPEAGESSPIIYTKERRNAFLYKYNL